MAVTFTFSIYAESLVLIDYNDTAVKTSVHNFSGRIVGSNKPGLSLFKKIKFFRHLEKPYIFFWSIRKVYVREIPNFSRF